MQCTPINTMIMQRKHGGFIDGARECLEGYKPIEELEEYIQKYEIDNSPLTIYDRGYLQAYRDFVKQEKNKESVINE